MRINVYRYNNNLDKFFDIFFFIPNEFEDEKNSIDF